MWIDFLMFMCGEGMVYFITFSYVYSKFGYVYKKFDV